MEAICTEVFCRDGHILTPGETCQAIFVAEDTAVDLYMNRHKISNIPKQEFKRFFVIRPWKTTE